jgi:MerR family transcriptional regulator, copper efflux regulator
MRIGELAAASGLTTKTLRFYEQAGLLPAPPRGPSGYRDYPPQALDRLRFIRTAQAAGLTLAEITGILAIRDAGVAPCAHVSDLIQTHLTQVRDRIAELRRTETELQRLAHRATGTDPAACTDRDVCTILTGHPPAALTTPPPPLSRRTSSASPPD